MAPSGSSSGRPPTTPGTQSTAPSSGQTSSGGTSTARQPAAGSGAAKQITDAMSSAHAPNFAVIFNIRDVPGVYGWLGLDKAHLDAMNELARATGTPTTEEPFKLVCDRSLGYYTDELYEAKTLQDRLGHRTLSVDQAHAGLREPAVDDVADALGALARRLGEITQALEDRAANEQLQESEERAFHELAEALGKSASDAASDVIAAMRDKGLDGRSVEHRAANLRAEIAAIKEVVRRTIEDPPADVPGHDDAAGHEPADAPAQQQSQDAQPAPSSDPGPDLGYETQYQTERPQPPDPPRLLEEVDLPRPYQGRVDRYVAQDGDTLSAIAQSNNIPLGQLQKLNTHLKDHPNSPSSEPWQWLYAGEIVWVPKR